MKNIMIDLETLGTNSNATILSIGAVYFDEDRVYYNRQFYEKIDMNSCHQFGLTDDEETVKFWERQSAEAKAELMKDMRPLDEVLSKFYSFVEDKKSTKIWGNCCSFDNVILRNAFYACDMKPPWFFWDDRSYRTLKNLFPNIKKTEFKGTRHKAIDDAINQAEHAQWILRYIRHSNKINSYLISDLKLEKEKLINSEVNEIINLGE